MQGLVTTPGRPHTTAVAELREPRAGASEVLLRTLEVGVCGTDREISEGVFGVAPDERDRLVLGHEFLGIVERDGHGFARGDLVAATVRRACGHCAACSDGSPDACHTGDYAERGITRLDGFASDLATERPEHLVRVPTSLGWLGVLAEPASVCARAIRHACAVAGRQPWRTERAQVMIDTLGLLRRNGVACLLGVDGRIRQVSVDAPVLGVDMVLQNRALLGSVNAHMRDWEAAVSGLDRARRRWGDAVAEFVGLRVSVDRFAEAFAFKGVKATLQFAER